MFNLPTLVTLTAPTCAGKSYLLEEMVKNGFDRIVSTTDREPRAGEVEGVHYFFISTDQSKLKEKMGLFAEIITYNGTRYGVTHEEMQRKLIAGGRPPIVILEPQGVEEYRKYCGANGYAMFSIYVETLESIRLDRLTERTVGEITNTVAETAFIRRTSSGSRAMSSSLYAEDFPERIWKIVQSNNKRLKAILEQERGWSQTNRWDAIVDGTDSMKALEQISRAVKSRNDRVGVYQ